ncbi:hypothetical protein MR988_04345 [bacterium]|nr:hypothetical protein [bacterium]
MKSSFYKVITGIIAVLGFIGGIILGNTVKINNFNTWLMIEGWVATAILCLIFYGIASALEYLEDLGAGQNISSNMPTSYNAYNDRLSSEQTFKDERPISKKAAENKWECPNCHSMNSYNDSGECPNCHWTP